MFLVDTNIISAVEPARKAATLELALWMDRNSRFVFLSTITIAEIEDGVAKLRREGATAKAQRLAEWLETVLALYSRQILPFDLPAARLAGALSDRARAQGHSPGFADIAIAAIAQAHGFMILTRNLRHFMPFGVAAHDPFASLPDTP